MKDSTLAVAKYVVEYLRGEPTETPPYILEDAYIRKAELMEVSEDDQFIYFKFRFPKKEA